MHKADWTEAKTDTGQVVWTAHYLGHSLRCFALGDVGWTATIQAPTWEIGCQVDTADNAKVVAEVLGRMGPGFMLALAVVTHEKAEPEAKAN